MTVLQAKFTPALIVGSVIGFVCLCQALPRLFPVPHRPGESYFDIFDRLEWMSYDWRMRLAHARGGRSATNLAAVFIDDEGLSNINQTLGFYWPLPRQLYGRAIRELAAQRCKAIACDVFFLDRHADFQETRVRLPDGRSVSSDEFLAVQLRSRGNVILGSPGEVVSGQWRLLPPLPLFRTNCAGLGYASTDRDPDGVLRRAKPFQDDPTMGRIWHLGLRLAAAELGLDLATAVVRDDRISLRGPRGESRTIPLDRRGSFLIDWNLGWKDERIAIAPFDELIEFDQFRQGGETNLESMFENRLVVIGSIGTGSNISDIGASPVEKETFLVSKHLNVANALLLDRFIWPASWWQETLLILLLGVISGLLTWRLRAVAAACCVVLLLVAYVAVGVWLFVTHRWWLPFALPVGGALGMTHICVVTWRVVFEQDERRRVKATFSRMVSPEVVNELLKQERLAPLSGTHTEITVLFADVRGFTKLTDEHQRRTEDQVRAQGLTGTAADAAFAENASLTLATVNEYLALIADEVKRHRGTLDKYIGDCVMAFWGAPIHDPGHAEAAVRAAIASQLAIAALNQRRVAENARIEAANVRRCAAGLPPLCPLGLLSLGTGINTGSAVVGLMGSDAHILTYTVFGREVNVASRLESVSGHGRIVISASTYRAMAKSAPDLAARAVALDPVTVKGIAEPVPIYEVIWRENAAMANQGIPGGQLPGHH